MEDVLKELIDGSITLEEALKELELRMYGEFSHNIDTGRDHRTGIPEVVHAEGKRIPHLIRIMQDFIDRKGRVLVSRLEKGTWESIRGGIQERYPDHFVEYDEDASFLIVRSRSFEIPRSGGKVGILTAGTSDIPVAKEAEITSREMGCSVKAYHDVGVAGVHRVMAPLKELIAWEADVLIVAAGREGALPTLVSGLVKVPVIGLPVSTGYGIHGKGETALFAMLQSCSPIAVVNIDAGFVAGAVASRIASGCHR
ncbi:MAG: nickel pincer cofactor biosynthesis protein LarB [Thermoplasmatota archaeon]